MYWNSCDLRPNQPFISTADGQNGQQMPARPLPQKKVEWWDSAMGQVSIPRPLESFSSPWVSSCAIGFNRASNRFSGRFPDRETRPPISGTGTDESPRAEGVLHLVHGVLFACTRQAVRKSRALTGPFTYGTFLSIRQIPDLDFSRAETTILRSCCCQGLAIAGQGQGGYYTSAEFEGDAHLTSG